VDSAGPEPRRAQETKPEETPSQHSDDDEASQGFALYTGRFIYDAGSMIRRSRALFNLARKPFVEMNDEDAKELEVSDGDEVVVRGGEIEAKLPVRITGIAKGAVFVPYDQEGLRANTLIEGVDPTVSVMKP
jgi:NADH-quinone oxidoreductase subunit G